MNINRSWMIKRTAFVFALLVLPIVDSFMSSKESAYARANTAFNIKFSYIYDSVFKKKGNIDFLFLGSSGVWTAIDAKAIEDNLDGRDGKKIVVENFAHSFLGLDLQYFLLKDVLSQKKITHLFLELPIRKQTQPHRVVRYLWNSPSDLFRSFDIYKIIYAEKSLESVRNIVYQLGILQEKKFRKNKYFKTNGSLLRRDGYKSLGDEVVTTQEFEELKREPLNFSINDLEFNLESKDKQYEVMGHFSEYQLYFLKEIFNLMYANRVDVHIVISPRLIPNKDLSRMYVMSAGGQDFNIKLNFLGVPISTLFYGLSIDETRKYFYNFNHLNANGAKYFTMSILPALKEIYDKKAID